MGIRARAVPIDAIAVITFIIPDITYRDCQILRIAMKWVAPQAKIKIANKRKKELKGMLALDL